MMRCASCVLILFTILNSSCLLATKTGWYNDCTLVIYISDAIDTQTFETNFFDCDDLVEMQKRWCNHYKDHQLVFYRTEIQHHDKIEHTDWQACQKRGSNVSFYITMGLVCTFGLFMLIFLLTHKKDKFMRKREDAAIAIVQNGNNQPRAANSDINAPDISFTMTGAKDDHKNNPLI